nr:hypothetical protein [Tanacetum cinerariifolium]
MILESVENGPLIWHTVEENGVIRTKKYAKLSAAEKIQADCDTKATNIILQGDDPIACLNKAIDFLTALASSRFPSTNNQLGTSSNPRNQATIQDGRVTVQQARVVKCYNFQGEGHMARQCTQPKQPRNAAWYKKKEMLAEAQEAGQILDEEQLAFLADPEVPDAILMDNISNYGSDVISKVNVQDTHLLAQQDSMILSVIEQLSEQMINHVNNWEKANKEYLGKMNASQMDDMIKEKLVLKEQVDLLEQNLSKQIKKECLLQAFTVFKDAEQAFYFHISNLTIESSNQPPVKVEVPSELPKVSLVNASLKKLKFHLAQFDSMVKKRTTFDARTEETKNVELENSEAKFLSENERLCNEINHVKRVFKVQFDSIKKTHVRTKEKSDSLIDKLNLKSIENEDLKAQIQDKVFVITPLKKDLRRIKGKEIVDIATQKPSANTIVLRMFKLDSEPLAHRITSANVVPPKTTTSHSVETQKPELKVYSMKPKNVGSSKKAKIVESKNANHLEPNHTWGSNATNIPSSSSLVMTGCPNCSLVSRLRMSKHMIGNRSQLMNFVSKFLGTDRFGNDHSARIMRIRNRIYHSFVFGALCYPTNDNENLGKLDAKYDMDIFVSYAPAKKVFRIYNKRTRKIIEIIHVTSDELIAMASKQLSSGPRLQSMTSTTSSLGLIPKTVFQQPCIPPNKDDWNHLFQPIFDEYFTPLSNDVSPVQEVDVSRAVDLADSSVSTSIDQDAPSSSAPST